MPASDLATDPLLASFPVHEGYKVLGGVVLYQKLGQGGMGAVYRGKHLRLNVDVALKVMAPPEGMSPSHADNFVQRFIREAQTAASVRHQNLIRVYDVNTEGGSYYLVMDYIDGESAGDRLKRKGKLAEQEAVEIALGAAEGLAEAHAQSIVHRDVKPDNILIDRKGAVVVADLGLAKAYSAGETDSALSLGLSLTQQAMGTPYYMSPEQTRSAKDVGPAADVWSLGVTLYQLVSGELPWSDTDLVELLSSIRKEAAPDVRRRSDGLSDGLCAIIERALRKEPAERYADCGEMAKALAGHLDSIRASAESVLPDTEAGATKMALVSVTPPPDRTLTLISEEALKEREDRRREEPRREDREERPSATKPTLPPRPPAHFPVGPVAAAAVALVAVVGAAVWFLASREGGEEPRGHDTGVATPEPIGVGRTGVAPAERRPAPAEAEPKVARTGRYEKWLDEALKLKLAGKPKEAAEAYAWAAKCAPAGSAEAGQATAAAAGCMHDYFRQEAKLADSRAQLVRAVQMYERALAKKDAPGTRKEYHAARRRLDAKIARELPAVKTGLAKAEKAENTGFTRRKQASLANEAAKEIARLEKLPPEKAAEEARALLVRFAGTPAGGEIEKMAFPAEPND